MRRKNKKWTLRMIILAIFICGSMFSLNVHAASVESAINWAITTAKNDAVGYSQNTTLRKGPNYYDCSSFVSTAFHNGGFNVPADGVTWTMRNSFEKAGFTWIPWSQIGNVSNLKRGDILLREPQADGHTEIYLGNNRMVGAHSAKRAKADQVSECGYADHKPCWDGVLRYNSSTPPTPTPSGSEPTGHIDSISGGMGEISVRGWTYDQDDLTQSLMIHVYIGGSLATPDTDVKVIPANVSRTDVDSAYHVGEFHGFDTTLKTNKTGNQEVYIYAISIGGGGNKEIGHGTVYIAPPNDPTGYIDNISGGTGTIKVKGWTFDKDDPTQSLKIHVYIGGSLATPDTDVKVVSSNVSRTDVDNVHHVGQFHGFDAELSTNKTGKQEVYIYAINIHGGANKELGHGTVNIDMKSDTGQTISNGEYHIVSALNSEKGLNVAGASTSNGANVNLYPNLADEAQVFHIEYLGEGYYKIVNKKSRKSIDVTGAACTNNTNVQMYDSNGSAAQQWIIKEAGKGWYYIYSKCNGLMLDVWNAKTDDGTNIQMHTPTGSKAQLWKFVAWSKDSEKTIEPGDYHIITASDKTKSLDLYEYNPANKTPIGICSSATNKRQVFSVNYLGNGYYTIQHKEAESAIEIWGEYAQKGAKINGYEYNKSNAQQWIIRKSPNSPYYNIVSKCGGFSINGDTSKQDHFVDATLEVGDGSATQDWLFIPDEDQKLKSVTKDLNATLTWNALSWADTYDLMITDANGKDFSRKGLKETSLMEELPAGTYTAYVKSSSDVYSLDSDKITFTTKRSAEDTVITDITFEGKTFIYDGTAKSLAISQTLPEGISVKYSGNAQTDAGTYTVTARFMDATGKVIDVKSAQLVINPKDASGETSGVTADQIPDQAFTGQEVIPEPVIKDGSVTLKKDKDYSVSYKDNTNAGKAYVNITFKGNYTGNYTGERKLSFTINKADNSWKKALACQDVPYETALKPEAEAAFGKVIYRFAAKEDDAYSDTIPSSAGTYYVKAFVEETDNYTGLESEPVEVQITKAAYDMSGITFEDASVSYDGEPKSLMVSGQPPLGVKVSYEGNEVTDVGEYTITAHFEGDSANYQPIPDRTAVLTIEPRKVMIPEGYNDLVYNGEEQQGIWESEDYTVLSGGLATEAGIHEATVRLTDKKNTVWEDGSTGDKKVKWTIAGDGNEWTEGLSCPDITYGESPKPAAKAKHGTVIFTYSKDVYETFTSKAPTEAGTYFVRARVQETEEYAGLENVMEFTIKKAAYDMTDVSFEDSSVSYDGRLKNITVKGELPEGLTVSYEGNGKVDVGSYEIRAAFTGDDNHEPIPEKKATLTILPRQADQVTAGPIADRTYSGRPQEPEPDLESDYVPLAKGFDYEVEYKDNTDTGTAKAIVTLKGNYEGKMEIPFTIRQAKNRWKTGLTCQDIPYGSRPEPEAEARFGQVHYLYSSQEDGNYTEKAPRKFGTWYVKALVEESDNYTGLESEPVSFNIQAHEHSWDNGKKTKEPTCIETGSRTFTCKDCGDTRTETIAATGHKPVTDPAVAATKEATGLTEGSHCSVCGAVLKKQAVIPKLASENAEQQEGSHETPVDAVEEDKKPSDSSSSSLSAARQEKAITSQKGDGDPKGSTYGILSARVKKSTKNSQTLAWNKVKGASGYLVYGNQCGTKYRFKKLAEIKKTSWTHKKLNNKKLKKGTYYKYIVVAYKTVSANKTVIATSRTLHSATAGGKAGNPKTVRVNKASISLKKNKTFVIKGKEIPASKKGKIKRHRKICFESDNPKVARVSASGKVKGLKKGTCRIYVYVQNGVCKVVKVKVK